ncbi:hypothetical protein MPSEU_000894200 [Mayamaea pseudoterrestris]|nr:hypothetical protein MPSEU_000894200 [Mayamaea pseudoterrestris]
MTAMSEYTVPFSLVIQIHKGPECEQKKRNLEPVLLQTPTMTESAEADRLAAAPCHVCCKCEARYKCPKCSIEYCSSECYRNHSEGNLDCSKIFYQDRMSQVLTLETLAKQEDFHRSLNRIYSQQQERESGGFGKEPIFDRHELLELLDLLDKGDEQGLSNFLHSRPAVTAAVGASLRRGDLSEWLLEPWHPWWRVKLSGGNPANQETCAFSDEDHGYGKTLDERLLAIPPFDDLRPRGKEVPKQLRYNILEILFSIVSTLHLFHGCQNAKLVSVEASEHLMQSSHVLSENICFESVSEALSYVATSNRTPGQSPFNDSVLQFLIEDVAIILGNRRFIGKSLLGACDILAVAMQSESTTKTFKKVIRNCQQKLKFYLAWAQSASALDVVILADEVGGWLYHWTSESKLGDIDIAFSG